MTMTRLFSLGLLAACGLLAGSPDARPVAEADYAAKIVGDWHGKVGGKNETISFDADGGFVSLVQPAGFIGLTLGQGVTDTIRGTWAISGKSITLNIRSAVPEPVLNSAATATIESFETSELVVKSGSGGTSTVIRQTP
jgi:hypothetical protein